MMKRLAFPSGVLVSMNVLRHLFLQKLHRVDSSLVAVMPGSDTLTALTRAGVGVIGPKVDSPGIVVFPGFDALTLGLA